MATPSVGRLCSFDRQQSLLSLDCSSDLRSYSRNLGPGVQEKLFQRTSDALRAQLDEHRDFLLRHQRNNRIQASLVPRVNAPVPLAVPLEGAWRPWPHTLPSHEPTQPLARPPTPDRAQSPVPGDIRTYPPGLRDALEHCTAVQRPEEHTIYHVIYDVRSTYMDDVHEISGTYHNLQEANEQVARMFLFDGDWSSGTHAGYDAEYEVLEGGALKCAIETDGSMGGYTEIYVRRVNLNEVKRSKRR